MTIVVPPASPGYIKYANSGVIAIAAGAFIAGARAGLNTYSDAAAPGPSQVQDAQSAASPTAALDSVVIDLDTVGAVTSTAYKVHVGYLVIDGGSADAHIAIVTGNGKVHETDWNLTSTPGNQGQTLNIASEYGMMEPDGWNVTDNTGGGFGFIKPVLKTGSGQTLNIRGYIKSGTGSVILDTIFLFPMTGQYFHSWNSLQGSSLSGTPYNMVEDGWVYPGFGGASTPFGWNGAFPASYNGQLVGDSSGITTAIDPNTAGNAPIDVLGIGFDTDPQNMWLTVRCVDPTKGVGKVRAVTSTGSGMTFTWVPSSTEYDVPADGNVYVLHMIDDPVPAATSGQDYGFQFWAPDAAQNLRVDMYYLNAADPAPSGPMISLRFRAAS